VVGFVLEVLLRNQLRRAETVLGDGGGAFRRVWWAASAASWLDES
jgi:hypothetical protein